MRGKPQPYEENRPWGSFRQFTHNELTTVKIITVKKGERNSLQAHKMRDESWVVIEGSMEVTLNDETHVGNIGDEFWVPAGTKHRFKGLGESNRLLEISFGDFDENDNNRFEDDYGRV